MNMIFCRGSGAMIVFKDPKIREDVNESKVIFDRKTGMKMRFVKENVKYEKSTYPELVDVKITNYCPFGCGFCYQKSTKDGTHAKMEDIERILMELGRVGVFEVALGGGETTMHPNFDEILRMCKRFDIVPNFTTFSKSWLKSDKIVESVVNNVGGIGVSVHDKGKYSILDEILRKIPKSFILAQHAVGTLDLNATVDLIRDLFSRRIPVLLLGYKSVGFGESYGKREMVGLIDEMKKMKEQNLIDPHLSVDTAFLKEFPDAIDCLEIDERMINGLDEGSFSMYIDAVDMCMGASSYGSASDRVSLKEMNIEEMWRVYGSY